MKVIQKKTSNLGSLRTMISGHRSGSFAAYQLEQASDAAKVAKEIEMQQMPGFGGALDYRPIVKALREIRYRGLVEIFMHPTPRGVPILPSVAEISGAVNKSRLYIEDCIAQTA